MATAHIESPIGTITPLNYYNYSCPASADGMHNWNDTFCMECEEKYGQR